MANEPPCFAGSARGWEVPRRPAGETLHDGEDDYYNSGLANGLPRRPAKRACEDQMRIPTRRRNARAANAATLLLAVGLACSQADVDADNEHEVELVPQAAHAGVRPGEDAAPRELRAAQRDLSGNLDPARRRDLNSFAAPRLAELARASDPSAVAPAGDAPVQVDTRASSPAIDDATAPAAPPPDVQTRWSEFLDAVQAGPGGGFSVQDVELPNEESLIRYFERLYDDSVSKGLVAGGLQWPAKSCGGLCTEPPSVRVCWTPDSDASSADKKFLEDLVKSTWGSMYIDFEFKDGSGNWRTCEQEPCGFFTCFTGDEEIKLWQTTELPVVVPGLGTLNGCSRIGIEHSFSSEWPGCSGDFVPHDYATIKLPVGDDYGKTVIHEFGHAIGLLHEHLRTDFIPPPGTCGIITNDRDATLPSFVSQGCTAPAHCYDDTAIGAYDPDSIMHYCNGGAAALSLGDVSTARTVYFGRGYEVLFTHSSWYADQVDLSLDGVFEGRVSSSSTPAAFATGSTRIVGTAYTVAAAPVTDPRLRCSATQPLPRYIRDEPLVVPTVGFDADPVLATCYDPAALAGIAENILQ